MRRWHCPDPPVVGRYLYHFVRRRAKHTSPGAIGAEGTDWDPDTDRVAGWLRSQALSQSKLGAMKL